MPTLECIDLAEHGVRLVPWSDPSYADLASEIRVINELGHGPQYLESSAILVNESARVIAGFAVEWTWQFPGGTENQHMAITPPTPSCFMPFLVPPEFYLIGILPGSKRLLANGEVLGDNTDVQPETMVASGRMGTGQLSRSSHSGYTGVVIRLDGAFFDNGDFVGRNNSLLWDHIYWNREMRLEAARIARAGAESRLTSSQILNRIDAFLSPHGTEALEGVPLVCRQGLESRFAVQQQDRTPEELVKLLVSWLDRPGPTLRRL